MASFQLLVLFISTLTACGHLVSGQKCQCGIENVRTRIIDGHTAQSGRYPWMTSVLIKSGRTLSSCGGSLINDRYILTAAHCMKSLKDVSQLMVTLGAHSAKDRQLMEALEVEEVISHPDWESFDDIALIKLKNPVTNVSPVCLPSFTEYDNLFVTGWGMTGKSGNSQLSTATQLMEVDIEEVDVMTCKRQHFPQVNPEKEICAGGEKGGSCMGDSGGPLQTRKSGRVYQVGIVSFGATDCATVTNAPNVYERVTGQLDWIKKHTADASWCDGPEQGIVGNKVAQMPKTTLRPTPASVVRPAKPIRPARPSKSGIVVHPAPSSIGDSIWNVRPGGVIKVSSTEDPMQELEKMMKRSGMSAMFPGETTKRVVVKYPGGMRTVVSSSSSSSSSSAGNMRDLEEQLSRFFN